jgi:hypothetical protein
MEAFLHLLDLPVAITSVLSCFSELLDIVSAGSITAASNGKPLEVTDLVVLFMEAFLQFTAPLGELGLSLISRLFFVVYTDQFLFEEGDLFLLGLHESLTEILVLFAEIVIDKIGRAVITRLTDNLSLLVNDLLHLLDLPVAITSVLSGFS